LEELSEKRHAMVQRLKGVEKERDQLSGGKAEAETYLAKQHAMLTAKARGNRMHMQQSTVRMQSYITSALGCGTPGAAMRKAAKHARAVTACSEGK
jgi:hypothetical protein